MSPAWLMIVASFLFAAMGVCVKLASAQYTAGEIVFYRGLTGAILVGLYSRHARLELRTPVPAMHFGRSLTGILAMCMWVYAMAHLPMATAMTPNYMSSVWMALFLVGGAVMLGANRVDYRLIASLLRQEWRRTINILRTPETSRRANCRPVPALVRV